MCKALKVTCGYRLGSANLFFWLYKLGSARLFYLWLQAGLGPAWLLVKKDWALPSIFTFPLQAVIYPPFLLSLQVGLGLHFSLFLYRLGSARLFYFVSIEWAWSDFDTCDYRLGSPSPLKLWLQTGIGASSLLCIRAGIALFSRNYSWIIITSIRFNYDYFLCTSIMKIESS